MSVSSPSILTTLIDVPEPQKPIATFVYNFFEPNEMIEGASVGGFRAGTPQEVLDTNDSRIVAVTAPRYVQIEFTGVNLGADANNQSFILETDPTSARALILDNFDKIQSELDISTRNSSAINLQDSSLVDRAASYLDLSVAMRADLDGSNTDKAHFLNSVTEDNVSGDIILDLIDDPDRQDITYVDESGSTELNLSDLAQVQSIKLYSQIDDRFLSSVLQTAAGNPTSPFSGVFSQLVNVSSNIQSQARSVERSMDVNEDEYAAELVPIRVRGLGDVQLSFEPASKIIGYIATKEEVFADGSSVFLENLVITNPATTSIFDSNVLYGSVYRYSLRSVAILQLPATSLGDEIPDNYWTASLVTSRSSPAMVVRCTENIPPPSPVDVNFIWDYTNRALTILWAFPPNSQRDIKKFQVFRRSSVSEPFTLLTEYDFDDSAVPETRSETPKESSVVYLPNDNPKTFYVDEEFTKDASFIYAICSIDAHDMSSNYSIQFRVNFDRFKNVLVKELVSQSGAPKPYPNFYLKSGLTVDSMKDSNHYTATIYFDPEYLSIRNDEREPLELLATKNDSASYKFQFINVDRQKSKILTIELDDLRT
ncbi:MAG TPA: hypothetical protein EYG51_08830 [Pseudomonadales bacterium]|nr:hypothetical protein [Pseudomonadales bacterium]